LSFLINSAGFTFLSASQYSKFCTGSHLQNIRKIDRRACQFTSLPMARRVPGTAIVTGRILACTQGPPLQPRCARRRSHRGGPTMCRPYRGDARPPLQHSSAPHQSDMHRAVRPSAALRASLLRSTPRRWPRRAARSAVRTGRWWRSSGRRG
jgi:hypothetical protein